MTSHVRFPSVHSLEDAIWASYRKSRVATGRLNAMKSGLEKREGPDRLVFQVKQARRLGNLLWTIVALIAFYLFWRVLPSRTERVPVACVILLLLARQIFVTWRGTHVELHVTNLDLVSKGVHLAVIDR